MNKKPVFVLSALSAILLASCGGAASHESSVSSDQPSIEPISEAPSIASSEEDTSNSKIVRLHYFRPDGAYTDWDVWGWDLGNNLGGASYKFTGQDDYGVYAPIDLAKVNPNGEVSTLGFIVRKGGDSWTAKDVSQDRSFDVSSVQVGTPFDVYVKSGVSTIFYNADDALKSTIKSAKFDQSSLSKIHLSFEGDLTEVDPSRLTIKINGESTSKYSLGTFTASSKKIDVNLDDPAKVTDTVEVSYKFDDSWTDSKKVSIFDYLGGTAFNAEFYYDGDDLGAHLNDENAPTATIFKLWAPTSTKVLLNIYNTGDYRTEPDPASTYEMTLGEKGVWSYTVGENLANKYYTYTVTNSAGTNEAVDPYAKSAGLNGMRGMIVNFSEINSNLAGWEQDTIPDNAPNAVDSSIYEIHIRDMTINPNSGVEHPGTFLGLAEKGTFYQEGDKTVSTGLDHLHDLGITTVQIQPFYDYKSVDEANVKTTMDDDNYNWGYDPQNYNCLEGSYSTNPVDGKTRISEFKQMVLAMHSYGIGINMDVVYNHTYETLNSNFGLIVPDYYYRIDGNGSYLNGSGCGNEVASNHGMVRKFIIDSTKFWASEYHLSGFRFDLMGLEDNQTMIDVYQSLQEISPLIRVYGEPWTGGSCGLSTGTSSTSLSSQQTLQASLGQEFFAGNGVYVGAFNDNLRDGVKGSVFQENGKWTGGWVQGNNNIGYQKIEAGIKGVFSLSTIKNPEPGQVLQYVSCHDNNTLHDQLIQTNTNNRNLIDMVTQCQSLVFTCQGVPFFQEGDDFMRSKAYENEKGETVYEHNSYISGDSVNNMDYALKLQNIEVFKEFQEIISLRKNTAEFRLPSKSEIAEKVKDVSVYSRQNNPSANVSFVIDNTADNGAFLKIIHCLNAADFDLGDENYRVIYSNKDGAPTGVITGSISLADNQSVVLQRI